MTSILSSCRVKLHQFSYPLLRLYSQQNELTLTDKRQVRESMRPKVDPKHTSIILFPGQGSQFVGMGEELLELPNVTTMFDVAKKILGYDLLELCLNGPIEDLNKTEYCQPATFVTSLGALEKLRVTVPGAIEACVATSGFSVGEFAALVFCGALSFEDALRLIKIRAEAMQHASDLAPSGMMTVIFGADARIKFACRAAEEWCIRNNIDEELAVCSVCNYLFPHCKVIGGHEEALKFIENNAKEFGIRRIKRLPVSGAFHTRLMSPVAKVFREALTKVQIGKILIPIYCNYDGKVYRNEDQIRDKLAKQISSAVRWEKIMHTIYTRAPDVNFPKTFECGPGSSLASILKMINAKAYQQMKVIKV